MRRHPRTFWLIPCLMVLVLPASGDFHLMKVVEVFAGTPASPSAQYIELQMYAPGQNFVAGHIVTVHDAAGALRASLQFPGDVGDGNNQARILIATPQAEGFFGLQSDLKW